MAAVVISRPAFTSKQSDDIAMQGDWVTQEGLHGLIRLCVEVEVLGLCAKKSFIYSKREMNGSKQPL